jgi:hypothetical protein
MTLTRIVGVSIQARNSQIYILKVGLLGVTDELVMYKGQTKTPQNLQLHLVPPWWAV